MTDSKSAFFLQRIWFFFFFSLISFFFGDQIYCKNIIYAHFLPKKKLNLLKNFIFGTKMSLIALKIICNRNWCLSKLFQENKRSANFTTNCAKLWLSVYLLERLYVYLCGCLTFNCFSWVNLIKKKKVIATIRIIIVIWEFIKVTSVFQ